MTTNLEIIKDLYAAAEASQLDADRFAAYFGEDGYFLDAASGQKYVGSDTKNPVVYLAGCFPDMHRELLHIYEAGDTVIVELKLQGTHHGDFAVGSKMLAPTGKRFDVPCCDVFRVEGGKVSSFHCYNEQLVWLQQLGAVDLLASQNAAA